MPRDREVRADLDPAGSIRLGAGLARHDPRERRGRDAGRPEHGPGRDRRLRPVRRERLHLSLVDVGDPRLRAHLDAEPLQLALRRRGSAGRERRQDPVHRLDEDDPGLGRVDRPEIALQGVARDLPERPGELHAGRPAADDHERHPLATPVGLGLALGRLERDEDAPADLGRVLDGLEPGRDGRPFGVVEIAVVGAGRDDERVVIDGSAVRQHDLAAVHVDVDRLAQDDRRVALLAQHGPQRLGDLARRQGAGRDLVEHRLEQVEVAPVDEGDRHLGIDPQVAGGVQPREAATDDHDTVAPRLVRRGGRRHAGHRASILARGAA